MKNDKEITIEPDFKIVNISKYLKANIIEIFNEELGSSHMMLALNECLTVNDFVEKLREKLKINDDKNCSDELIYNNIKDNYL